MGQNIQELVDSLGQVLSTGATSIDGAIKALTAALNQGVAPVTSGQNPVVDAINSIISDNKQRDEDHKDFLENKLPDKFYKAFEDGLDEIRQEVSEVVRALQGPGGGPGGKAGGTGKCDCESALQAINQSVAAVHSTLTGGVRLESDAMNALRGIRRGIRDVVRAISAGGGGGRGSGRASNFAVPTQPNMMPEGNMMPENNMMPTMDIFGEIMNRELGETTGAAEDTARQLGYLNDSLGYFETNLRHLTDTVGRGFLAAESRSIQDGTEQIDATAINAADRRWKDIQGTLNLINFRELDFLDKTRLNAAVIELTNIANRTHDIIDGSEELEEAQARILQLADRINRKYETQKEIVQALNVLSGMLVNRFMAYSNTVFGTMTEDLNEWEKEATRMAATMTGNIHAAGGEATKMVGKYRDLLHVSDEVVNATHQFPGVIRKQWLTAIKKGTRSLNETKDVISSAAAGAWQIGAAAETAADEFQRWNMEIGMSAEGATSLARTMTSVAKTTGVMGDNLLHAVSSAREISQLMRDTGLYSQMAANSMIGMFASAQKFGVDKQMQNIFRAAQGGLESFMEASAETRNLIAASGKIGKVLGGDSDPEELMKGVGDAIRNAIPRAAFQTDEKGKPVGLPDLKKLSKAEISRLDLIMKRRFGMKLGESVRLLESIQDQNPEEKLAQIERDLRNPMLSKAEKEQLELQKEQLKLARDEKKLSKILDSMGAMSASAKSQGDMIGKLQTELRDGKITQEQFDREMMKVFPKMLKDGKMTEATFKQAISDSAKLLSEKMGRQGKTFKDAMGMSAEAYEAEMKNLTEGMKKGDLGSFQRFNDLRKKMEEANKLADSTAKNNSNTLDKQESDLQRFQNWVQNAVKGIHTMVTQMNVWILHATAIAGGVWALYRWWKGSKIDKYMQTTAVTLVDTIGTKGSGWVHDPYVEHFVKNIDKNIAKMGAKKGTAAVKELKDSTKVKTPGIDAFDEKLTTLGGVLDWLKEQIQGDGEGIWDTLKEKLMGGAEGMLDKAKEKVAEGVETVKGKVGEKISGMLGTDVKKAPDTALMPQAPATKLSEAPKVAPKADTKLSEAPKVAPKAETKLSDRIPKGQTPDVPKMNPKASKAGGIFKDSAAKLAAIGAGLIVLGAVMVGLTHAIMKMTGFTAKDAQEVSWVIGSVIGAAAAVMLATALAVKTIEIANKVLGNKSIGEVYKGAGMLLLLVPAVAAIGLAVVGMGALLAYMMDPKKASEYAWAVAQILGAAAIITGAVLLASAALAVIGAFAASPLIGPLAGALILGAGALLLLVPAMILMAVAIAKVSEGLSKQIDIAEAQKTSKAVADILLAAGTIAGAVLLGVASLTALGAMTTVAWAVVPAMIAGAAVLLALTPAMIYMARGIVAISSGLYGAGDVKKAAAVSKDISSIMWSAGQIAAAVLAGAAILTALGAMMVVSWAIIPAMIGGAAALIALTPAMIKLALAVINLAKESSDKMDADAAKSVDQLNNVFKTASDSITAITTGVNTLNEKVAPLVRGSWFGVSVLDQITDGMKRFSNYFRAVADALILGIINPVLQKFPPAEDLKSAGDRIQATTDVISILPKFINDLSGRMTELNAVSLANANLSAKTMAFSLWLNNVSTGIRKGVIEPMKGLISVDEVTQATQTLSAVTSAIKDLVAVVTELSSLMQTLSAVKLDFSSLESVGGVFKSGKLELTIAGKPGEAGVAGEIKKVFVDRANVPEKPGTTTQTTEPINFFDRLSREFMKAANKPVEEPKKVVADGTNLMDRFAREFMKAANKPPQVADVSEKVVRERSGTDLKVSPDSVQVQSAVRGAMPPTREENVGSVLTKVSEEVTSAASVARPVASLPVEAREKIKSPDSSVAEMVVPQVEIPESVKRDVKPIVSKGDFDAQVQARVEQTKPSASMKATTDYLAEIAVNTGVSAEELKEVRELLTSIKGILNAGGGSSPTPLSKPSTSQTDRNYREWKFGRYADTSAKQVVNAG